MKPFTKRNAFFIFLTFALIPWVCFGLPNQAVSADKINEWPLKHITFMVPYPEGGGTDSIIRGISPAVQRELGCTLIIENRGGGNGVVGTLQHKLNDPADGSVICFAVGFFHSAGGVRSGQYKFDDFDYIGYIIKDPSALVVHAESEYGTIYELIDAIRKKPGKFRWGMQANAAASVGVWIMNEELGLRVREIPYEGGGPMRAALVGKHVDFFAGSLGSTQMRLGETARFLLNFDETPHPLMPDLPIIKDVLTKYGSGAKVPDLSNVRFFFVKKGFKQKYPERYKFLVRALAKATSSDLAQQWAKKAKALLDWEGPEKAERILRSGHQMVLDYKKKLLE